MKSAINSLVFLLSLTVLTEECHQEGYPFEQYLGTKTPYRLVSNKSFEPVSFKGCEAKKAWMIVRHGTRNPSDFVILEMKNRLPQIKSLIVNNKVLPNEYVKNRDLDLFRKWKFTLDVQDDNKLAHEGEEEMLLLAERMQSRFPEIFDDAYSNTSYKFKYTYSQRTKKSAYYFTSGLFGRGVAKDVWYPDPLKKDPILRFYKLCEKWRTEVKENPVAMQEKKNFDEGPEMVETLKEVNERLGLGLDEQLTTDDIVLMHRMCGFETAWNKKSKSPWCSVFTLDNLKVLEYSEDLKYYWQDGYGHELTYKQACPAFGDMVNFLENKSSYPKVSVYFTHSGTLLKLLAHAGLYRDSEHLTANNFAAMSGRKFRTSRIDSFATNLAFVLFNCDGDSKVLTLHQENIVRLPSCPDSDLCELDKITWFYSDSIDSCDFEAICNS